MKIHHFLDIIEQGNISIPLNFLCPEKNCFFHGTAVLYKYPESSHEIEFSPNMYYLLGNCKMLKYVFKIHELLIDLLALYKTY